MAGEDREKCMKIWGETGLQRWYQDAGTMPWFPVLCTDTGKESLAPYPHAHVVLCTQP